MSPETKIRGRLVMDGWSGRTETEVEVIGQTRKRLRIRAITQTKIGGRNNWLQPGEVALVPTHAVLDNCSRCNGRSGGVPGNENVIDGKPVCDFCDAKENTPNV